MNRSRQMPVGRAVGPPIMAFAVAALLCAAAVGATLGASGAGATQRATGGYDPPVSQERPNPCLGDLAELLLCPDLRMAPPSRLYARQSVKGLLLHARNNIRSRGDGPIEVRGRRSGPSTMSVRQMIAATDGLRRHFDTDGQLIFYDIPGQGPYWKFHAAARFELWSLNGQGEAATLVRKGPKLSYCLRDLALTAPSAASPPQPVYPACSQDRTDRVRTLGTSVGWSDIYPASYYQNWINVRGLRGCFLFIHRADPRNYLFEDNETNNTGERRVLLPPGPKKVRAC